MNAKCILLAVSLAIISWQVQAVSRTPCLVVADNGVRQKEMSWEQWTENNFYDLVKEISGGDKPSAELVCTDFPNRVQAFSFICTLIGPESARKVFYEGSEYSSGWLELEYSEENVGNGFAILKLKFKKRSGNPSYTIVFSSGKMPFDKHNGS